MILFGKRGQASTEFIAQQKIIYVLISMIFLILGMLMANHIANEIDIKVNFETKSLAHGQFAARLLNSATCFAWEEQIAGKHQVHAGVVDVTKLQGKDAEKRMRNCLDFKNYHLTAYKSDGTRVASFGIEEPGNAKVKVSIVDTYMVKFRDGGKFYDGRVEVTVKWS